MSDQPIKRGDFQPDGSRNILIAGPTASGKSGLAMDLAQRLGGTVINADALQVYSCWRDLTARPSVADERTVPHNLYGHIHPSSDYSVGHWLRDVQALSDEGPLILVGGTGLYFRAITHGLAEIPDISDRTRTMSESMGIEDMISALDPDTRAQIDLQNPRRVQRAWEVQQESGIGLAQWHANTPPPLMPLDSVDAVVLAPETDRLNAKIARRFREMIRHNALEEVAAMAPSWDARLPACQAIGAPELLAHLRGEVTLDAAIEAAIVSTRQYAKRQRTWFRSNMRNWTWIEVEV